LPDKLSRGPLPELTLYANTPGLVLIDTIDP